MPRNVERFFKKKISSAEDNELNAMASPSGQTVSLEVCRTRIKNYAESKVNVNEYFKGMELDPNFYKAGVLVPIFIKGGSLHVLLTKRTEHLSTHKGQVAFPGGKQEEADKDIVATALREAHEEVGLPPDIVEVIAVLRPLISTAREISTYVYPVIGMIRSNFDLVVNPSEVQATFDVPLDFFLQKDTHRHKKMTFREVEYTVHWFDYRENIEGHDEKKSSLFVIWGLTGEICLKIAITALSKLPEFELPEWYSELIHYIQELNSEKNSVRVASKV